MGKRSEITYCLMRVDFYTHPSIFPLCSDGKLLMDYCIRQGAKNNTGMFIEHRGAISMKLRLADDFVHDFFVTKTDLIGFDPVTHLIWIKSFFEFVDFGLTGEMKKTIKSKKKGKKEAESKEVLDMKRLFQRTAFISKIKSTFRDNPPLKAFEKSWTERNFVMLNKINDQVRIVEGNRHNLDGLLGDLSTCVLRG